MHTFRRSLVRFRSGSVLLGLMAMLAFGCGQHRSQERTTLESNAPAGTLLGPTALPGGTDLAGSGMTLIPIAVGQRWDYRVYTSSRLVLPDSPEEVTRTVTPTRTEISGVVVQGELQYFTEANYDPRQSIPPVGEHFWLREDDAGRYYLDRFVVGPADPDARGAGVAWVQAHEAAVRAAAARSPHRAAIEASAARASALLSLIADPPRMAGLPFPQTGLPARGRESGFRQGSPLPGEITHLLYPLFRGSRWIVRDAPRFTRNIVGRERLTLPAGEFDTWSIRGGSEFFGPNDRVQFYYAAEGLVRMRARFESVLVDVEGNPIGEYITEMDQQLVEYSPGLVFTGH